MRSQEVLIDRGLVLNIPQLNLQIIEITITVQLSRYLTYQSGRPYKFAWCLWCGGTTLTHPELSCETLSR